MKNQSPIKTAKNLLSRLTMFSWVLILLLLGGLVYASLQLGDDESTPETASSDQAIDSTSPDSSDQAIDSTSPDSSDQAIDSTSPDSSSTEPAEPTVEPQTTSDIADDEAEPGLAPEQTIP